jgi:3-hydroxy-9,10-secoandrosta-1,3,5(10)-triene-9,17-dione monooxygenase reductase component
VDDLDADTYRAVLRRFATGVAVVTTWDGDRPWGTTVNSFSSVSLRPPLVLVAFDRGRRIAPALHASGRHAVNILGEDQQALSDCFAAGPSPAPAASSAPDRGELCGAAWLTGPTRLPLLQSAIASLECTIVDVHPAGDHDLYIARVDAASAVGEQPMPLPTPTPTPTPTNPPTVAPTETPFESFLGETATPIVDPTETPFESFLGETAGPGSSTTPPPTGTGSDGSSSNSTPLFALLISLVLGGLWLAAVQAQRRSVRR